MLLRFVSLVILTAFANFSYAAPGRFSAPLPSAAPVVSVARLLDLSEQCLDRKEFADAEALARRALQQNKLSLRAKRVLGMALAGGNRNPTEAVANLRDAATEYPEARLEAVKVLLDSGALPEAMAELEKYLESKPAARQLLAK